LKKSMKVLIAAVRARMRSVSILSKNIRSSKITFVSRKKLRRLAQAVYISKTAAPNGAYIEAGVALGGTAVMIAKLKPRSCPLLLYDVYGMIPPPSTNDAPDAIARYDVIASGQAEGIGGEIYYGYRPDIKLKVIENLERFDVTLDRDNVSLIEGVFEETLFPRQNVSFAHIDCDWYDSVTICINRIWPLLMRGGVMLFDDYRSYEGCRKAVDHFLEKSTNAVVIFSDVSLAVMKK
jgi:hypothetical protein